MDKEQEVLKMVAAFLCTMLCHGLLLVYKPFSNRMNFSATVLMAALGLLVFSGIIAASPLVGRQNTVYPVKY